MLGEENRLSDKRDGELLGDFRQYGDLLPIAGKGALIVVVKIARFIQCGF